MRSKTFLFNRGMIVQDIRNVGWIGIVYFLCLLFALPLQILLAYTRDRDHHYFVSNLSSLFSISHSFQVGLLFIIPVLLSIFLFRYMQVKSSSDYIHSLPMKRGTLYHLHIMMGMLILILPVLLTGVILLILGGMLPVHEFLSLQGILEWMVITSLYNLFVFFAGTFVGMLTGMSLLQGALIYIMFIFPVAISVLVLSNLQFYWYGFSADYYLSKNIEFIVPFIRAVELSNSPLKTFEIAGYLLLIILFYISSLWLYRKRNVEAATQAIAFRPLQPIFQYGVTFSTMLVGGLYFGSTTNESFGWILFGYISASIIGYVLAVMVLEKSWRVLAKWKGYAAYVVAIVIVGIVIQMDLAGYEQKLPSESDISQVYFAETIYFLTEEEQLDHHSEKEIRPSYLYQEEQNTKNILAFHEQILADQTLHNSSKSKESRSVVFGYELENGKKFVRQYHIPFEEYERLSKPIVESREYKQNQNPVLTVEDLSELDRIVLSSPQGWKRLVLTDPDDMKEFHQLLQSEIESQSIEESLEHSIPWADVEYLWADDQRIHTQWKKSYVQIEEWLEKKGLLDQARITAEDIAYAIVIKNEEVRNSYEYVHGGNLEQEIQSREDVIRIKDPVQLEEALQKATWSDSGPYIVAFYYTQQMYPDFQTFPEDDVPEFIRKEIQ